MRKVSEVYTVNRAYESHRKNSLKLFILCHVVILSMMLSFSEVPTFAAAAPTNAVTTDEKIVYLEMSKADLIKKFGNPSDIQTSEFGGQWHIYAQDYKNFMMASVNREKVDAIYASGVFSYVYSTTNAETVKYTDKNNDNKQYAVLIKDSKVKVMSGLNKLEGYIESVERLSMHLANASRAQYGLNSVTWNQAVADVALLHCVDMADNDYFAHSSQDGRSPGDRLEENGVNWRGYAENLAGGIPTAITLHNEWMNSEGHRENILHKNMKELGVSMHYQEASRYKWYIAELFYLQ